MHTGLVIALLAVSSCGPEAEEAGGPGAQGQGSVESRLRVDTIDVVLDDYVFGMPATLPSGEITLRISNEGVEEHDLMFTRALGDSVIWRLPSRLGSGGVTTQTLSMEPGSYQVVCDFAGHVGRGMITTITVQDER